jgi:hypothetical protein
VNAGVWDGSQRDAEELVELLKTLSIDVFFEFFEFFKAVSMLVPDWDEKEPRLGALMWTLSVRIWA